MSAASALATSDIPVIAGLSEIAGRYDAILCDVWGVLIDGRRHFPDAVAALRQFRGKGGRVVLITNASRPDAEVREQLLALGLPADCFDDLVSAGELTLRGAYARPSPSAGRATSARRTRIMTALPELGALDPCRRRWTRRMHAVDTR